MSTRKKKAKKRVSVAPPVKRGGRKGPKRRAKKSKKAKGAVQERSARALELPVGGDGGEQKKALVLVDSVQAYVEALAGLGFLSGPTGKQRLSRQSAPLVRALHQVLAGGTLDTTSIRIEGDVDRRTVRQLDNLLRQALNEANLKNRLGALFYG